MTFTTALAAGTKITATATSVTVPAVAPIDTPGSTSEFSNVVTTGAPAGTGNTISGTVYEDVNGDASLADAVGARDVTVHLWADLFGSPTYIGSTVTNASGQYTFTGVANGTYGVIVDSKTIDPSAGFNVGFGQGDVWAEQTYGSTGAAYWTGTLPWTRATTASSPRPARSTAACSHRPAATPTTYRPSSTRNT